jgi:hypothetical protein
VEGGVVIGKRDLVIRPGIFGFWRFFSLVFESQGAGYSAFEKH